MRVHPDEALQPDKAAVLTKAVLRAGDLLQLTQRDLSRVIGVSESSVSRMPERRIDPRSKEGELSRLFLRVFRSLSLLVGGDLEKCRAWLRAPNRHLGAVPADLLPSVTGLIHVLEYLDALRGKL
jgi:hypothetical protein